MGPHILKELDDFETDVGGVILADTRGQMMWSESMRDRFAEFDYEYDWALEWHPRGRAVPIIINPRIAFGAPILEESAIPTSIIRERHDAGESIEDIEEDFSLKAGEVREALRFEGITIAAA
jgi:uncharacterized protein (DUF433 family)